MEVELFIPCFIDQLYPNVAFNMIKVLEKVGCTVFYNPNQTCCGQPAMNAGFFKEATEVAEKFLDDFTISDRMIVSPSASCVGMVCNGYEQLLKNNLKAGEHKQVRKRIHEFSDFLVNVLRVRKIEGAKLAGIATYHDSCSALRECNIKQEPRILLESVEGLELVEMEETDQCCGFGGTFAAKFEAISVSMTEVKIDHMLAVKPDYLISTDSSCLLQYQTVMKKKGIEVAPMHLADVLASGW